MYFLCKFNVKCPKWSFFYVENKNGHVSCGVMVLHNPAVCGIEKFLGNFNAV